MFLKTLGMKESTVLNWVKLVKSQEAERKSKDKRKEVRIKLYESKNSELKTFLNSLPKVESHYCWSSSSKLNLEPMWSSTTELFKFYKRNYCHENNITPVSTTAFFKEFNKETLSFIFQKKTCAIPA